MPSGDLHTYCKFPASFGITQALINQIMAIGINLPAPLPSPEVKDECRKPQPSITTTVFLVTIPHLKDTQGVRVITQFISIQDFNDFKDFNVTRYRKGVSTHFLVSLI